jgi:mRNA interferase MazF
MVTKVQKWGNSLGVRLPSKLAQDLEMTTGAEVDIQVVRGRIIITPVRPKRMKLADLLKDVRSENLHEEVSPGRPRGKEAW